MKKFLIIIYLIPLFSKSQLNGAVILSGHVINENHQSVPDASISIKNTSSGTTTDSTGHFSLIINQKFPFTIIISSIGFAPQEIKVENLNTKLSVQLTTQTYIANEVVITASRQKEKLLQSPITIEKLDIRALK